MKFPITPFCGKKRLSLYLTICPCQTKEGKEQVVSRDNFLIRLTTGSCRRGPFGGTLNRCILILLLSISVSASAQTKPTEACLFEGFESVSQKKPNLAEVNTKTRALTLTACGSSNGCFSLKFDPGSPVLISGTMASGHAATELTAMRQRQHGFELRIYGRWSLRRMLRLKPGMGFGRTSGIGWRFQQARMLESCAWWGTLFGKVKTGTNTSAMRRAMPFQAAIDFT